MEQAGLPWAMPAKKTSAEDADSESRAEGRPYPIDPPAGPGAGDEFRAERSGRIGARTGERRFEPRQNRKKRGIHQRCERLGGRPRGKHEDECYKQKSAKHLARHGGQKGEATSSNRGAPAIAGTEAPPLQQQGRAQCAADQLGDHITSRIAWCEPAFEPKGKSHGGIDMRATDTTNR